MSKVFLLTGFNNWGKTSLITKLFERERFYKDKLYPYGGQEFCVQSQSNDDLGFEGYKKIIEDKIEALGAKPSHILTAFCPTDEPNNNSADLIENLFSEDEVHLIAIKYKWCLQAKLDIKQIEEYYSNLKNVRVRVLAEKNIDKKKSNLDDLLKPLL